MMCQSDIPDPDSLNNYMPPIEEEDVDQNNKLVSIDF